MSATGDETANAITNDNMPDDGESTLQAPVISEIDDVCCKFPDDLVSQETDELEDGELPEDGEIMDDIEEAPEPVQEVKIEIPKPRIAENNRDNNRVESEKPRTNEPPVKRAKVSPDAMETTTDGGGGGGGAQRRPSPPESERYFRRETRSPPDEMGYLPPRRRPHWTEKVLCKFFREGFCRDGEQCVYSHNAEHSNRKPELCKFYQQGFCKKGLACTLLHGEYPCKEFHSTGECTNGNCKYSHVPLNDFTRPVYDRMRQDEALAAQIVIPEMPQRRRTLLRRPPPTFDAPPAAPPARPPLLASPAEQESMRSYEQISPMASASTSQVEVLPQIEQFQRPTTPTDVKVFPPLASASLSLDALLDEIAATSENNTFSVESRISPSESALVTVEGPKEESPVKGRPYELIPLAPPSALYDVTFLKKMNSDKFKRDPRIQALVNKQFDEASNMFDANLPTRSTPPDKKKSLLRRPGRDPRGPPPPVDSKNPVTPSAASDSEFMVLPTSVDFDVHSGLPHSNVGIGTNVRALDDYELKTLVEKQLEMVKTDFAPQSDARYRDEGFQQPYNASYDRYDRYDNRKRDQGDYEYPRHADEYRDYYPPARAPRGGRRGYRGPPGSFEDPSNRRGSRSNGRDDFRGDRYSHRESRESPYYRDRDRREFRPRGRSSRNRSRSRSPHPSRSSSGGGGGGGGPRDRRRDDYGHFAHA